jgi:predicted nucleic acid-binding protein
VIVIDASAAVDLLLGTRPHGVEVRRRLRRSGGDLHAPHLLDAEVGEALRKLVLREELKVDRAMLSLRSLRTLPINRHVHRPYLGRAFSARHNLTFYDSLYLVLAVALNARLLTRDEALAAAAGSRGELIS